MGAAIWSAEPAVMRQMPAAFFVRFFDNHGLLTVNDHPTWRVVKGGSRSYLSKLIAGHADRVHLSAPVESIRRLPTHVLVKVRGAEFQKFDQVFIACHSDQALAMLEDPTPEEREVLGAIRYQSNQAVLHTDARLMPGRRLAWAAWNYHVLRQGDGRAALTYNMNILQRLDAPVQFCVTLNNSEAIDESRIIRTIDYEHPVFTPEAVAAQRRHAEINGARRSYYCGAYWRFGFHEDGVVSALNALQHFEERRRSEQRDFRRVG
jgi:predicted NAD/FAD-binding protein